MSQLVPVGAILSFAGEKNRIPEGWLPCEGQLVSNEKFPDLFSAIGTVWGGSGTPNFYLPDLRGMFLRGVSGDTDNDPEKLQRRSPRENESPSNPGNHGNNVGSVQSHAFSSHDHNFNDPGHGHLYMKGTTIDSWGGNVVPSGQNLGQAAAVAASKTNITFAKQGGLETRPLNAYIFYIIKVTN